MSALNSNASSVSSPSSVGDLCVRMRWVPRKGCPAYASLLIWLRISMSVFETFDAVAGTTPAAAAT
jgi:hypothetical protein